MTIQEIIDQVITLSGRDDLEDNKNIVLGWINRYKLYLQRDKRICFSEIEADLTMQANVRTTPLPSDFLFPITIRRLSLGLSAISRDLFGNQFVVTKDVTLHRNIRREEFFNNFPLNNTEGSPFTGAVNDYILEGRNIIWGPIPNVTENLKIDYYRLLPEYNLQTVTEDDFSIYYGDGLLTHCLERVFTDWVYDDKKKAVHARDKAILEAGLRKYQVNREHPMESTLNLPDM